MLLCQAKFGVYFISYIYMFVSHLKLKIKKI